MSDEAVSPFASKTITIGEQEFLVTELSGKVYDECIELARVPVDEAHPFGIDAHIQLIFMTERAVSPKMTLADINNLPFSKRAALFDAVNEVHAGTGMSDEAMVAALTRKGYVVAEPGKGVSG